MIIYINDKDSDGDTALIKVTAKGKVPYYQELVVKNSHKIHHFLFISLNKN